MGWPTVFSGLAGGNQPLSLFDTMFTQVAQMVAIPCTASGTNAILLTPIGNAPVLPAYQNYSSFRAVAAASSTNLVTAQAQTLPSLPVYLADGTTQANINNILIGQEYVFVFVQALNGGSGGFFVESASVPLQPGTIGAAQLLASAQGMNAALNLRINATVGGNALTVAIKTAANADPSGSSPVLIPFRDPTLANGDQIVSSLQVALNFTVAFGNTMGALSANVPFRLWMIGYYNGGTPAVGLFNASTATQIFGLPEGGVVTTAAGTAGGNNAGTHYANVSAITNTPFRILGYLEWATGLATAGTWASGPTTIQLFGPGIKKPGDLVQKVTTSTGALATGATALPNDDTIPQITEGDQFMSQAIIPQSGANILKVEVSAYGTNSANNQFTGALFQDAVANALAVAGNDVGNGNSMRPLYLVYLAVATLLVSTTFRFRAGAPSGTTTFNGAASARLYGGVLNSFISVEEIMG